MAVEEYFDDDVNEDNVASGGFDLVAAGFYPAAVVDIREKEDNIEVDFQILPGGTKPSESTKVHREFVSLNSKKGNRQKRLALALACNLTTKDQVKAAREQGHGLSIDYPSAVGQICAIEIEQSLEQHQVQGDDGVMTWVDKPGGKMKAKIPYDHIWHVSDPCVVKKGIKIDKTKLEMSNAFGGDLPKPAEPAKAEGGGFF